MWAWAGLALAAPPSKPCGTREQLAAAPLQRRGWISAAAGGALDERDAYDVPSSRSSEHFILRWGPASPPDPTDVQRALDAFELAWDVEVERLGHRPPYGSGLYRFNVYVGDTGGGTPLSYGAGGYQTFDVEGFPMIVVARNSFVDPAFLEHTAVHEFYHAIQSETGRFPYDGISAWYWEATAEWAAIEAAPDNPAQGVFAPGYVWLPEVGVEAFDYPDEGTLVELHQYGAFLFAYDVAQVLGTDIVTETWKDQGQTPDPWSVMARRAEASGYDLRDLWLDHLAGSVILDDHPLAVWLEPHFNAMELQYPGESVVTASVSGEGGSGRLVDELAPTRHGAAVIGFDFPVDGTVHLRVEGAAEGDRGSPASWGGRVVIDRADGPERLELPFDGRVAELDVDARGDDLLVVVGADTPDDAAWAVERFPLKYDFSVTPPPARPRRLPVPRSCDGSGVGGGVSGLALAAAAALVTRRRRAGR